MATPQGTPMKQAKLGIVSAKSLPLTNEYKKLLSDQHQRLALKHQQDLDLLDDIRGYVKSRLSIERDYTIALQKLAKQHASHISKKFTLLHQLEPVGEHNQEQTRSIGATQDSHHQQQQQQQQQQHSTSSASSNNWPSSLYKVWWEHTSHLQASARNRSDQFEQLNMIVDKLKDIRQHKSSIGKKCLETHLRRIQEDLLLSIVDVERSKKLYYEDESQAKKARENEERIKKKRTGLLTKFTDLQAKKEKSSAQREATDIQSTQARNDYIMALAAVNAHLKHYYHRDLNDFIHLTDDGVLDQCKIFMATLSECDINSLKDSLQHAQSWSKLINATGSQQTNYIFLESEQSRCLRTKQELAFEACNNDPIQKISLEHNADYALQHEIDKWFTWFKKECRNLSQLMHQLDTCQHAFAEGKKSIEVNGQTVEDLEPKIIELKQLIRRCEAAKLKAQARLMVIKEGGMQIEEWSDVELEIRADMARAHEEQQRAAKRLKEAKSLDDSSQGAAVNELSRSSGRDDQQASARSAAVHLQISRDSDSDDEDEAGARAQSSMHNLASVSRSTSNLAQKQQAALTGYSALTDPSLAWQDDYSSAWNSVGVGGAGSMHAPGSGLFQSPPTPTGTATSGPRPNEQQTDGVGAGETQNKQQLPNANMSIQSSSPLSAIVNGGQHLSQSPYQVGLMSEAYKSDYECDYARTGPHSQAIRSAASSVEPSGQLHQQLQHPSSQAATAPLEEEEATSSEQPTLVDVSHLLNKRVIALYSFERTNADDLAMNEDDLLTVIETNPDDTHWIKARLESTGEQGYIPSAYVRLLEVEEKRDEEEEEEDEKEEEEQEEEDEKEEEEQEEEEEKEEVAAAASGAVEEERGQLHASEHDDEAEAEVECGPTYCRALYDYTPEANTFEEDGLPHLALVQGELMRIIDQGAEDGWWLVEKQPDGERGHVPSMLVEETNPDDDEDQGEDENFEASEIDDEDDDYDDEGEHHTGSPPAFEAPVLAAPRIEDGKQDERPSSPVQESNTLPSGNSLVPTSFIIIEPTPEVESRRFGEETPDEHVDQDEHDAQSEPHVERQVCTSEQLPSGQVSYSVVNEDFVLEGPPRRPNSDTEGETLAGGGLSERVAPPSVVIDCVEAIPRSPDLSFDEPTEEENRANESGGGGVDEELDKSAADSSQHSETSGEVKRVAIKHTGNVDVSPILRLHADEFCKQLIEEALLLAPGSRIGPSTSSANVTDERDTDAADGEIEDAYELDDNASRRSSYEDSK